MDKHYVFVFLYTSKKNNHNENWLRQRIKLAKKTSLRSLKNQTNQDFETVIVTNEESISLLKKLLGDEYIYIITKHDKTNKLDKTTQYEKVYVTRLDSDDMYHPDVINDIKLTKLAPKTKALVNNRGYIYDTHTKKMSKINHPSISFQTIIFSGREWKDVVGLGVKDHSLTKNTKKQFLPPWKFLWVVHSKNWSSSYKSGVRGWGAGEVDAKPILRKFLALI